MRKTAYWLAAVVSLWVSAGCSVESDRVGVGNPIPTPTPTGTQETGNETPEPQRPATKTETISVEGVPIPISLTLFDSPGYPFTTYYPEEYFVTQLAASGEGTSAWFFATKPDGTREESVYVHFFFPPEGTTVEQMQQDVLGEKGLLKSNQWELVGQFEEIPYKWATQQISFMNKSDPRLIVGNVFIGNDNGRVFRVTAHFPAEYADGFSPRTSAILKNVELR